MIIIFILTAGEAEFIIGYTEFGNDFHFGGATVKIQYKTKNRQLLLEYLAANAGRHVTAQEIIEHFKGLGISMGTATVYRQLERFMEEGLVNKYLADGNGAAAFEYVDRDHCGEHTCFHCKCEKCGALIHLHCHELEAIERHIFAHHGFKLDSMKTVFYGVCDQCS